MAQKTHCSPAKQTNEQAVWRRQRSRLEAIDYRNWRTGAKGFGFYRFKHQAIVLFGELLKVCGLYKYGYRNACDLGLGQLEVLVDRLPLGFAGYRILHLSDLHLDSLDGLGDRIASRIREARYDICVMTGDYRFARHGAFQKLLPELARIVAAVDRPGRIYGVLGNHDTQAMVPPLERIGIRILANQSVILQKDGDALQLTGVDDPHDYLTPMAIRSMKLSGSHCKVLLAHSPELYQPAEACGFSLYLCGHTHGGQICLPGGIAILTFTNTGRHFYRGLWRYGAMAGHTSPGCGAVKIPIRFNCPPEITVLKLRSKPSAA
ncbi:MAG: metallophosphoesterase [Deltaproteobacteria bacterium]|nr:metallophosphoesterase [Deltaproteobacteria bacterium]